MFAEKTKVSAEKSASAIKKALLQFGCKKFELGTNKGKGHISFVYGTKRVKINFTIPPFPGPDATIAQKKKYEQATNVRWRELLICIKGKLESVATEVETFEQAFMAHINPSHLKEVGGPAKKTAVKKSAVKKEVKSQPADAA